MSFFLSIFFFFFFFFGGGGGSDTEGVKYRNARSGRVVRWCWVNFQSWGVLLIWTRVGQGPTALALGASGGCLDMFNLVYHFSFLSPFLLETARYRLKYCLKGPLSPKQPANQQKRAFVALNLVMVTFIFRPLG